MLAAAFISCGVGLGWLALAMDVHWRQVCGDRPLSRGGRLRLRVIGATALALSLGLCFAADHPSMAPLVWVMALAGGALLIAFALAWRPVLLRLLVLWPRAGHPHS
jgi:hypothetical protein